MSPSLARLVVVSLATLLVLGGTLEATAAFALADAGGESEIDPERVDIRIRLYPDGSADWTIEYAYRIDTDNRSAAFDDLQADVRANRSRYESSFRNTLGSSVARARNETGREMAMRDVSVSARRQQIGRDTGLVTYRFRWTNFSRVTDSGIVAGDAIDGFIVDEKTRLTFTWPASHDVRSVSPSPADERTETAVAWEGYTNFPTGQPRLTVRERPDATVGPASEATPTGPATGEQQSQGTTTRSGSSGQPGGTVLASVLAAVVVLVGALGVANRRNGDEDPPATDDGPGSPRPGEDVPVELMSNEERVLHALRDHGGRMKQLDLREELDWPAPKTSKVLGTLKEDDAVDVFRLGRENVVTLPETGLMEDTDE